MCLCSSSPPNNTAATGRDILNHFMLMHNPFSFSDVSEHCSQGPAIISASSRFRLRPAKYRNRNDAESLVHAVSATDDAGLDIESGKGAGNTTVTPHLLVCPRADNPSRTDHLVLTFLLFLPSQCVEACGWCL
jgi:hypothetical protein